MRQPIWGAVAGLLLLALLLALPVWLGEHFLILLLINIFITSMLTLGLQLLIGISGILSLGHAAFFGVGAYGSAILTSKYGMPFLPAILIGGVMSGFAGLLMSPIIRLRGIYFAMATFAFGIIVYQIISQWKTMTGGHDGLIMIPIASIAGISFDVPSKFYYLVLIAVVLQILLFTALSRSRFGRLLSAMRQSEAGARSIGLNITAMKVIAITIAAVTAGIAGGLYAHLFGSISPDSFNWEKSIALLTMVVVGGSSGYAGVILSTAVLIYLPEQLRAFSEYSLLINGAVLTLVTVFLPDGIGGLIRALRKAASGRGSADPASTVSG
jgi:branched-chain amino acid transport system permease protein